MDSKLRLCWAVFSIALAGSGCATDTAPDVEQTVASPVLGAPCVLGDGYSISSGGNKTINPVTCGSDCNDYPNGGFDYTLYCLNGVLGDWNPALAGGSVGPAINPLQFNGNSRCTALANPWSSPRYAQSADRKHCVAVP